MKSRHWYRSISRGVEKHCLLRDDALRHEPQVQKVSVEEVESSGALCRRIPNATQEAFKALKKQFVLCFMSFRQDQWVVMDAYAMSMSI